MIRSVLAVLTGFVVTAAASMGTDVLLMSLMPTALAKEGPDSVPVLLGVMAYCLAYAAAGGYVAAAIARRAEARHALVLGLIFLAVGVAAAGASAVSGEAGPKPLPLWYAVVSMGLVVPATWLGGYLRARQRKASPTPAKAA
jgi:hypothetical protein